VDPATDSAFVKWEVGAELLHERLASWLNGDGSREECRLIGAVLLAPNKHI
jgi:hypothetical protein